MGQSSLDFLNIFVDAPGDFLYFLVVVLVSMVGLFMVISQRDTLTSERAQQYRWAWLGVVIGWAVMFIGALVTEFTPQQPEQLLPPLSRAVSTANIVLIGWAFLSADHRRWRTLFNGGVLAVLSTVIIAYMLTGVQWVPLAETTDFNLTVYGIVWALIPAVLSLIGSVLCVVLFRQVVDAPLKLLFFLVLLAGHSISLYQMAQGTVIGNYVGAGRLVLVIAMGLALTVMYRLIIGSLQRGANVTPAAAIESPQVDRPDEESKPVSTERTPPVDRHSVQLLKSLGMILDDADPMQVPDQIIQTTLTIMRADVAAIIQVQDANYGDIRDAYDRTMDERLPEMALNFDEHPTLVNAIEHQRQRGLYIDRNMPELDDLYTRLNIDQRGTVYFQPLIHQQTVIAVLMAAYPYTKRELRPDEIELLKGLGIIASSLLALSYEAQDARMLAEERAIQAMVEGVAPSKLYDSDAVIARQEMQENLKSARSQVATLSQQVMTLKQELEEERKRLTSLLGDTDEEMSISQQIRTIASEQESVQEERDRLAKRLQEAEAALSSATATDSEVVVTQQVEQLQREVQSLMSERDRLKRQLDDLRAQDKAVMPENIQPLLNKMMADNDNLRHERDQLRDLLDTIENELRELGIEDDQTGLAQWIHHLYNERSTLADENERLKHERQMLLDERESFAASLGEEKAHDEQLDMLRQKIENLASDRETAIKQRDKLRGEIDLLQESVNRVKEHRARLLAQVDSFKMEIQDAHEQQQHLQETIQQLRDDKSEMANQRDRLAAEKQTLLTERDQLLAQIDGDPARLQQVNDEGVGVLQQMINDLSEERDRLERELNEARQELAQVNTQLDVAEMTQAINGSAPTYHPEQPELLVGLVQDLRTPLTSISWSVDLLLGESQGILGAAQRRLMHRVAANITRLDTMIDGLISITELDTGRYRLKPRPVDVVKVVEDVITNASIQFRERELAVNLDIEDDLPLIEADEDSITQIMGQLLTNAYLASPPQTAVSVTVDQRPVRLDDETVPTECLFIAVEDRGGGILPEDLPRVFARKYKAENPLIEGLGDTGVGMAIAKALVEAHNGKLWVDVKSNVGSVFNIAIPLDVALEVEGDDA